MKIKKNSYLQRSGQSWKMKLLDLMYVVAGILFFGAFASRATRYDSLFVYLVLGAVAIGIVGFGFQAVCLRCKSCNANLGWEALNGHWRHDSKECPFCHAHG